MFGASSTRFVLAFVAMLSGARCGGGGDPVDAGEGTEPARSFASSRVAATLGQLSRATTTRGFEPDGTERRGFLVEHSPEVVEVAWRSGACYVVVASATEAVRELELQVFDAEGTPIARDEGRGPLAAMHVCPPQSGAFYVAVEASLGNGLYGVRSFRGPSGLEVRPADILRAAEPERTQR